MDCAERPIGCHALGLVEPRDGFSEGRRCRELAVVRNETHDAEETNAQWPWPLGTVPPSNRMNNRGRSSVALDGECIGELKPK